MKCVNCHKACLSQKSVVHHGDIIIGCENCYSTLVQGNELAANHTREAMKRTYAQDIVQPIHPREFIKAYGAEKSKEFYSEDLIRKFS